MFIPRSILSNGSLHVSNVQHGKGERSDEGVYQCVATLPSVGTMLSRSAKLQTTSLRPFEQEPKDVVVRVGDVARFNCYVHVGLSTLFRQSIRLGIVLQNMWKWVPQ